MPQAQISEPGVPFPHVPIANTPSSRTPTWKDHPRIPESLKGRIDPKGRNLLVLEKSI